MGTIPGAVEDATNPGPEGSPRSRGRTVRNTVLGLLVAVLVTAMVLVAWGGKRSLGVDPRGTAAPDFTLSYLEGDGEVTLSDLRGQVVVLNFWASWCTECKREAPVLEQGWQRYRSRGVLFLGIDTQDSRRWGRAFHEEYGITYRSVFDGDSRTKNRYGVSGIPETFVIDAQGIITGKHIGAIDTATLDELVTGALTRHEAEGS